MASSVPADFSAVRVAPFESIKDQNITRKMALTKELSSIKRFGARYGRTVKHKFAKIERQQRQKYKCPYCNYLKVRRVAAGIWQCGKCNAKFTGKAYTISKKIVLKEEVKGEA